MRWIFILANGLALSFLLWPALPAPWVWQLLSLSIFCTGYLVRWLRPALLIFFLTLMALWWQGHRISHSLLPAACDGTQVQADIRILQVLAHESLPHVSGIRFDAELIQPRDIGDCTDWHWQGKTLRLSWWGKALPALLPGQEWTVTLQVYRPRGQRNWYADDYQLWLMREGIGIVGKVRSGQLMEEAEADSVRDNWQRSILDSDFPTHISATLIALGSGDRQWLSDEDSRLLMHTGTAHLLAISGLHIGLAALMGFWLFRGLASLAVGFLPIEWAGRINQIHIARVGSLLAAAGYCWFGGAGVSTQRALVMLCLYFGVQWCERRWRALDVCLVAMWVLLLWNPLQASAPGFYLSFFAVFCLLLVAGQGQSLWAKWLSLMRLQLWLVLAMLPLSLWFFSGASLVSWLANLLAVPWVSLVAVPALLASVVFYFLQLPGQGGLEWIAASSVDWLFVFLRSLESLPPRMGLSGWWEYAMAPWLLAVTGMVLLAWVIPFHSRLRVAWLLVAGSLLMWNWQQEQLLSHSRERLVVFDVGQGLSVLVESGGQRLLYDTGPPFGQRTSAMERIVLPFLQRSSISHLDHVVVSHGDVDHAGGLAHLLAAPITVSHWWLGEPLENVQGRICDRDQAFPLGRRGMIRILSTDRTATGNDSSCVLELRLPWGYFLFTGDVSVAREWALSARLSPYSPRVLFAPHHGSRSSSSYALLSHFVGAPLVVSAGHNNSYGHPHVQVLSKAAELGLQSLNTAELGAIMFSPGEAGQLRLDAMRETSPRFWQ